MEVIYRKDGTHECLLLKIGEKKSSFQFSHLKSSCRYTNLVDRYVPNITACLRDPSPLIRKQTLTLVTKLLQVSSFRTCLLVPYN